MSSLNASKVIPPVVEERVLPSNWRLSMFSWVPVIAPAVVIVALLRQR